MSSSQVAPLVNECLPSSPRVRLTLLNFSSLQLLCPSFTDLQMLLALIKSREPSLIKCDCLQFFLSGATEEYLLLMKFCTQT